MVILPLIISSLSPENTPPIVAAGGVATGAQIASLLVLGASGVALGTRFLLSPESLYSDIQRHALISADSSLSVRTLAFDLVRDTLGWPKGIDGRALRNGIFSFPINLDLIDIPPKRLLMTTKKERISPFLSRNMPKALKATIQTEYWSGQAQELD